MTTHKESLEWSDNNNEDKITSSISTQIDSTCNQVTDTIDTTPSNKKTAGERMLDFFENNQGVVISKEKISEVCEININSVSVIKCRDKTIFKNGEKDLHTIWRHWWYIYGTTEQHKEAGKNYLTPSERNILNYFKRHEWKLITKEEVTQQVEKPIRTFTQIKTSGKNKFFWDNKSIHTIGHSWYLYGTKEQAKSKMKELWLRTKKTTNSIKTLNKDIREKIYDLREILERKQWKTTNRQELQRQLNINKDLLYTLITTYKNSVEEDGYKLTLYTNGSIAYRKIS